MKTIKVRAQSRSNLLLIIPLVLAAFLGISQVSAAGSPPIPAGCFSAMDYSYPTPPPWTDWGGSYEGTPCGMQVQLIGGAWYTYYGIGVKGWRNVGLVITVSYNPETDIGYTMAHSEAGAIITRAHRLYKIPVLQANDYDLGFTQDYDRQDFPPTPTPAPTADPYGDPCPPTLCPPPIVFQISVYLSFLMNGNTNQAMELPQDPQRYVREGFPIDPWDVEQWCDLKECTTVPSLVPEFTADTPPGYVVTFARMYIQDVVVLEGQGADVLFPWDGCFQNICVVGVGGTIQSGDATSLYLYQDTTWGWTGPVELLDMCIERAGVPYTVVCNGLDKKPQDEHTVYADPIEEDE